MDYRHGAYGSAGVGVGSQKSALEFPDGSQDVSGSGVTWYAAIGWGLTSHWAIGAELDYTRTPCSGCGGAGTYLTNTFYSAAVTYFPSDLTNFFVKLNVGYGTTDLVLPQTSTEGGFAAGIGFGYNWRVGEQGLTVKPFANYLSQLSSATFGGALADTDIKGRAETLQIGVGVGYKN